jgi:hypothetical protein
LIDAVSRIDIKSVELQARVGIAMGLVVVGDLIGEGSAPLSALATHSDVEGQSHS